MKDQPDHISIISPVQMLSIAITSLGGFATGCAVHSGDEGIFKPAIVAVLFGIIALFTSVRIGRYSRMIRGLAHAALGVAVIFPLVEYAMREVPGGHFSPLEIPLISLCRNALFGMAMVASGPRAWRRMVALSLFAVTMTAMRLQSQVALSVLAAFALIGCLWLPLMFGKVHSISTSLPGSVVAVLFVGGSMLAVGRLSDNRLAASFTGLLPSSGGTGGGDEKAASGLGDGPDEVAGSDRVKSIGFDQSQTFMNSAKSGLYDAFIESSGAPLLRKISVEKMQMLRLQDIRMSSAAEVDDYRAGQRFTLDRMEPASNTAVVAHDAPALLYVDGALPVHLRTNAYFNFDGTQWSQDDSGWPGHSLHDLKTSDMWFEITDARPSVGITKDIKYRIRVGALVSDTLPLPALANSFHLGRVVRSSLLKWKAPDLLQMTRRSVPPGTVLDVACATFDPTQLAQNGWKQIAPTTQPMAEDARITSLAHQWAEGLPQGWQQVASIINGLNNRCHLNRSYRAADTTPDRVAEFLFVSHQGPDYLFATSAAVMLRSLGYSTRLASGFYAGPGDFDAQKRQAVLNAINTHFWAEIQLPNGQWAIVEATPGYLVAGPQIPWRARMTKAACAWLGAEWGWLLGVGFFATFAVLNRLRLLDLISSFCLTVWPGGNLAARARRLFWWLEVRARWAGSARSSRITPARWVRSFNLHTEACDAVNTFANLINWAFYAPLIVSSPPISAAEFQFICQAACRHLTASKMRNHGGTIL
jgi:hypothetical protein